MPFLRAQAGRAARVARLPLLAADDVIATAHAHQATGGAAPTLRRTAGRRVRHALTRGSAAAAALELRRDLRRAISNGELTLHYQPQADPRTGEIKAAEALVRWEHPTRGVIPPGAFIPVIAQSSLMHPLTLRLMEIALRDVARWEGAGHRLRVGVNVASPCLRDAMLAEAIAARLGRAGVTPNALKIEITEETVMAEPRRGLAVLHRVRALGVQIALDDFGTGYSSLAQLKRLPVRELKIAREFIVRMVEEPADLAMVETILALADHLNLRVVAEGVHDAETWSALAALGCDRIQGFYLAPPMPADAFGRWLADDSRIHGARSLGTGPPKRRFSGLGRSSAAGAADVLAPSF